MHRFPLTTIGVLAGLSAAFAGVAAGLSAPNAVESRDRQLSLTDVENADAPATRPSKTGRRKRTTTQPVRINVASRLAIVTLRLRAGKVARPFKAKLATIGGVLPKKWKITGGKLPRGVRLNTALGVLLGTPRKEGTYRFTVEVVDALGVASTKTLTLVVNA